MPESRNSVVLSSRKDEEAQKPLDFNNCFETVEFSRLQIGKFCFLTYFRARFPSFGSLMPPIEV